MDAEREPAPNHGSWTTAQQDAFEKLTSFVNQEEPARVVDSLIETIEQQFSEVGDIRKLIMRVIGKIDAFYASNVPPERFPQPITRSTASSTVIGLLDEFDDSAVSVEASAEERSHQLRTILNTFVREASQPDVTKEKILASLRQIQGWYISHAPKVSDIIDNNS